MAAKRKRGQKPDSPTISLTHGRVKHRPTKGPGAGFKVGNRLENADFSVLFHGKKNIIPGSFVTPKAIAYIMTQKFVMDSPLYRQEKELNRQGIHLSRQTMSTWILRARADYLAPVCQHLHEELLKKSVLHADETTLQVLYEPRKISIWIIPAM